MQTITCDEPNTFIDTALTSDGQRLCLGLRTPLGTVKVALRRPKLSSLLGVLLEREKAMLELEACDGK